MIRRLRPRSLYDVLAALAFFGVLAGGTAYAANTVFSSDIVDGEVKTNDLAANAVFSGKIADQQVKNVDLGLGASSSNTIADGGIQGIDVKDNTLKGADIDESTLSIAPGSGDFVTGRGTLLSNRVTMPAGSFKTLLRIPGLGEFGGLCGEAPGEINWANTTPSNIDVWEAGESASVVPPDDGKFIATLDGFADATIALGLGNDPGSRTIATVHVFGFQSAPGAPCGFQAQGTLWTSG